MCYRPKNASRNIRACYSYHESSLTWCGVTSVNCSLATLCNCSPEAEKCKISLMPLSPRYKFCPSLLLCLTHNLLPSLNFFSNHREPSRLTMANNLVEIVDNTCYDNSKIARHEGSDSANTSQEKVDSNAVSVEEKNFQLSTTNSFGDREGEIVKVPFKTRVIYEKCKVPLHIFIGLVMTGYVVTQSLAIKND